MPCTMGSKNSGVSIFSLFAEAITCCSGLNQLIFTKAVYFGVADKYGFPPVKSVRGHIIMVAPHLREEAGPRHGLWPASKQLFQNQCFFFGQGDCFLLRAAGQGFISWNKIHPLGRKSAHHLRRGAGAIGHGYAQSIRQTASAWQYSHSPLYPDL